MAPVKLSGEVVLALAICLAAGSAWAEDAPADPKAFLPIALKCPAENDGVLEFVKQDSAGERTRLRVKYENDVETIVEGDAASPGEDFRPVDGSPFDLRTETDPDRKLFASQMAARSHSLFDDVCVAPAEKRAEYFAKLKANRKSLGLP